MTLRELQYLLALKEHRSFRRAAEVCLVSQPTLSMQLRKLEEELGVTLIERAPRRVMLTPVGEKIVSCAERAMSEIDQIKDIARQAQTPDAGLLRLGVFPTLGPYLLPSLVPQLRQQLPKVELHLIEEKSDNLIERLRDGRLDAALLALPVIDDGFDIAELFEEHFLLAVPAAHELASRTTLSADELGEQELMLLEEGHCLRDQAISLCERTGAHETSEFRATSLETLRQMVVAGVGITLLPALSTRISHSYDDSIKLLSFSDSQPPSRTIGMVWRKSSTMVPILRQVAEVAQKVASDMLGAKAEV